ncbi:MAG: hypothetical protein WBP26_04790 [Candidatus Saccharimonadales bacterium]
MQPTTSDQPGPTPPSQPAVPPAPGLSVAPTAPAPVPPAPRQAFGMSRRAIAIIAGSVVLALVIILALGWFFLWSPQAQAKRLSNSFMKAMTSGDIDKAVSISGKEDDRAFLKLAADNVEGSFTLSESSYKDGKGYYLYNLQDAERDYARTVVAKEDGKLQVTSFVYSDSKLSLVPGSSDDDSSSSSENKETSNSATPRTSTKTASACLSQNDYKWMNYDKKPDSVTYDATYDPSKFTNNKIAVMFFQPDSTKEETFTDVYDDWAEFAEKNSDKQWVFRLEGSTYGSDSGTDGAKKLANERSQKVKDQLMQRGVPASRIVIAEPHHYEEGDQDFPNESIFRQVQVLVDPTCTAT